jgi:hypothetical protein
MVSSSKIEEENGVNPAETESFRTDTEFQSEANYPDFGLEAPA